MRDAKLMLSFVLWAGGISCELPETSRDPSAPKLLHFAFKQQAEQSTSVLIFTVEFEDKEGDLSQGYLEGYWNKTPFFSEKDNKLSLEPVFLMNELDPHTQKGTFHFSLLTALEGPIRENARFEVRIRLIDKENHPSQWKSQTLKVIPLNPTPGE